MKMTLLLQVNADKIDNAIVRFDSIDKDFDHVNIAFTKNIEVRHVPEELEYEVSKYIFNKVEIFQMTRDNEKFAAAIKAKQ